MGARLLRGLRLTVAFAEAIVVFGDDAGGAGGGKVGVDTEIDAMAGDRDFSLPLPTVTVNTDTTTGIVSP